MKFKPYLYLVVGSIMIIGFSWFYQQSRARSLERGLESGEKAMVKSISADEFGQLLQNEKAFVLDVHVPKQTHIPRTDAFIPYDQINKNLNKLPVDKTTPLLVYCRSGSMSKQASKELILLGYKKVYHLSGGVKAYKQSHTLVAITPDKKALGKVVYGQVAKTSFTLTNFTNQPLTVTRVSTSCGCTKASVEKDSLAPYEETTINVSFDPSVHKDDTNLGEVTRTIFIETDNEDFSQLEANITAFVVREGKS